jgi:catechol-2,3-dioxygenase
MSTSNVKEAEKLDESQISKVKILNDKNASANLAVKDLEVAKEFYGDILGFDQVGDEGQEVIIYKSGNSTINVYRSQYAGTNKGNSSDVGRRT